MGDGLRCVHGASLFQFFFFFLNLERESAQHRRHSSRRSCEHQLPPLQKDSSGSYLLPFFLLIFPSFAILRRSLIDMKNLKENTYIHQMSLVRVFNAGGLSRRTFSWRQLRGVRSSCVASYSMQRAFSLIRAMYLSLSSLCQLRHSL